MRPLSSICLLLAIFIYSGLNAQVVPPFTNAAERSEGYEIRKKLAGESMLKQLEFKSVGPAVFGGRVTDIAVNPDDPTIFYVAYASGGLWKSVNNGGSFTPIFENEAVFTIGAIAVDWESNTIWVGTGEVNSSRSSYAGNGVYKSVDDGKNWTYTGLGETHHIGRVVVHPSDPNIVWVAALGHLYSPNKERGIFKTEDGGETWSQTLFVDENSGAVDLILDPENPNLLFAATWHRERRAWNFVESGNGSGIYKSSDGGENWALLTTATSGFPHGGGVGRIGLTMTKVDGKNRIYSVVDNYGRRPKESTGGKDDVLSKDLLRGMTKEEFLKLKPEQVKQYLAAHRFPKKYKYKAVKKMVEEDKILPSALVEYLEDANSLLFDSPVIGAEVYRSDDEGKTWTRTHKDYLDQVFFSYGYYFGLIRVSPHDPDKIYIAGVPILISKDGGASWKSINGDNVHVDHHALWVDPDRDERLILGNDGGLNISYDDGENWIKCNTPAVGQFYTVAVDDAVPYNIYGGLQDNGVWVGPSNYKAGVGWHNTGKYPYRSIFGGDGMQIAIDNRNNDIVYTGFQFGNYSRLNLANGDSEPISPSHELGERPLRFNWQTPIHLSIHNQDILYMGANKFYRSMDQGNNWMPISEDLTTGGIKGDVAYSTLTSIHESPLEFGLLYAGSDDGEVHVSKNGGNTWTSIKAGLPERMWVTRIQASAFKKSRVYLSMNGYRWDDFKAYVYKSEVYGTTWERIGEGLPSESVNVIKEDLVNDQLLYVGTDHGLYISTDGGRIFHLANKGMPAVPVHDLVVHPREKDLVVATHGRSFYKANVSALQELSPKIMEKDLHLFAVNTIKRKRFWGNRWNKWMKPRVPNLVIPVAAGRAGSGWLTVKSEGGLVLKRWKVSFEKGINYFDYDFSFDERKLKGFNQELSKEAGESIVLEKSTNDVYYLPKGKFDLLVEHLGEERKGQIVIK